MIFAKCENCPSVFVFTEGILGVEAALLVVVLIVEVELKLGGNDDEEDVKLLLECTGTGGVGWGANGLFDLIAYKFILHKT